MSHRRHRLICISILIAAAAGASGCGAVKVPRTEPLPITRIQGAPAPSGASAADAPVRTEVRHYPGHQSLPPLAKAVGIEKMAFRSVLADAGDQTHEALENDGLIDRCADGRPSVDFIQAVDVGVRHASETDDQAILVAQYRKAVSGLCGFHLTTIDFDMKDYVSDYVFVIRVTGTQPPATVTLGGYYTVQAYEGI